MDSSYSRRNLVNSSTTELSFNDYPSVDSSISIHYTDEISSNGSPSTDIRFYIGDVEESRVLPRDLIMDATNRNMEEFKIEIQNDQLMTNNGGNLPDVVKEVEHTVSPLLNELADSPSNRFISCESKALIINNQEGSPFIADLNLPLKSDKLDEECTWDKKSFLSISLQVFLALFISSGGNFGAGIILDTVQKWKVFSKVPELYYLIPTLLGLKGNLEMTMVARLSTKANMGDLRTFKQAIKSMVHNIALVQSQAMIVSFLASIVTFFASYYEVSSQTNDELNGIISSDLLLNFTVSDGSNLVCHEANPSLFYKVLIILASAISTANIACLGSSKTCLYC